MSEVTLTPRQSHALFDILIHHQIYAEIESFKYPIAIDQYGYPFQKGDGVQTTSPMLQNMLNKFVLRLPGLRNVSLDFWQDKVSTLVRKLAEAELSETYDKGSIGARKALATAISSLLEYVGRGMLGGYPAKPDSKTNTQKTYSVDKPDDILQAWEDGMRELVYGELLDELFEKAAESDQLKDHSTLVQAAHEYILLNLASFMHHIFVMSPDGQYILRLIENVHRLIPYTLIRQTLRVGNAATMINGMVRLILAKLSVAAVTNWIGLTNNTNDGMNLLQQIISTVMAWDTAEFQKRAQKLESTSDAPKKDVFKAIRTHVYAPREKHDTARNISQQEEKSIIGVILETSDPSIDTQSLSEQQHTVAMEYYSTYQSIRDREELTKILCKMQPDLLTSAIRDGVAAFDPVIRAVHKAVDLSGTITDAEAFLTDLVKVSKPKTPIPSSGSGGSRNNSRSTSPSGATPTPAIGTADTSSENVNLPTVEDYVRLLRKHIPSSHRFLHQVCKNAPDLARDYHTYATAVLAEFRVDSAGENKDAQKTQTQRGAGSMTDPLLSLFESLAKSKQDELKPLLDQHAKHLDTLKKTSRNRLEAIMSSPSSSSPSSSSSLSLPSSTQSSSKDGSSTTQKEKTKQKRNSKDKGTTHGPGMYLSRWHSLLDSCYITPATLKGPVRRGWEVKGELDGKASEEGSGNAPSSKEAKAETGTNADAEYERERRRDGLEEDRIRKVWEGMESGWTGVCRGLEVMGD